MKALAGIQTTRDISKHTVAGLPATRGKVKALEALAGIQTTRDISKHTVAGLPSTRGKVKHFMAGFPANSVQRVKLIHAIF